MTPAPPTDHGRNVPSRRSVVNWKADLGHDACLEGWEVVSGLWRNCRNACLVETGGVALAGERSWYDITINATVETRADCAKRLGLSWGHDPRQDFVRPYHIHDHVSWCFLFELDLERQKVAVFRCHQDGARTLVCEASAVLPRTGTFELTVATDAPDLACRVNGECVLRGAIHPLLNQAGRIGLWADGTARFSNLCVASTPRWTLCRKPVLDGPPQPVPLSLPQQNLREILVLSTDGADATPIDSPQLWEAKKEQIKRNLRWLLGNDPQYNLPLNPRVVEEVRLTEYTRRKILLAATPDNDICAYMLIPPHLDGPAPAVIIQHPSGVAFGKHAAVHLGPLPDHRQYAEDLALRGYIAFAFDNAGYGERPPLDPLEKRPGTSYWSDYAMAVYDIRRIVDYLCAQPEVDGGKIGLMGHSRGGWIAPLASAFDRRIAAVVASGARPTMHAYGPKALWGEHVPRRALFRYDYRQCPVDDHETMALTAPRPFLKLSSVQDWHVPVDGCDDAMREVAKVFQLLGVPGNVRHCKPDCPHGLDPYGMAAAWNWFDHWLMGKPLLDDAGLRKLAVEVESLQNLPAAEFRLARRRELIAVHATDFTGGADEEFPWVAPYKQAWSEKPLILSALPGGHAARVTAAFTLAEVPRRPLQLLIRGTTIADDEVRLRVSLNGAPVFDRSGVWKLPYAARQPEYPQPVFLLQPRHLRPGENALSIENVSAQRTGGGKPHFLLFYVVSREPGT